MCLSDCVYEFHYPLYRLTWTCFVLIYEFLAITLTNKLIEYLLFKSRISRIGNWKTVYYRSELLNFVSYSCLRGEYTIVSVNITLQYFEMYGKCSDVKVRVFLHYRNGNTQDSRNFFTNCRNYCCFSSNVYHHLQSA